MGLFKHSKRKQDIYYPVFNYSEFEKHPSPEVEAWFSRNLKPFNHHQNKEWFDWEIRRALVATNRTKWIEIKVSVFVGIIIGAVIGYGVGFYLFVITSRIPIGG